MAEFIKVTYTGKDKDTNEIFDTNDAEAAKKANSFHEDVSYRPVLMILGDKQLIQGFEEALTGMKAGESKSVTIPPEKAYGQRNAELIRLVPEKIFLNNQMQPYPGMVVEIQGVPARVQSVNSGRVRLDLNHELAGKTLLFDVKVEQTLASDEEKIGALFERLFPEVAEKAQAKKENGALEIVMPKSALAVKSYEQRKAILVNDVKKYLKAENVKITEIR